MAANISRVPRMFVSNLSWTVGVKELREYFSQFGFVTSANVIFDRETGLSKGYGFIEFGGNEAYTNAMSKPNHVLDDQVLNVQSSVLPEGAKQRNENLKF